MKYNKYTNNAYNLHVIQTNKFKSITIKINFKNKVYKESITYRNLLNKVLLESSIQYPDRRLLEIECENLYNLSVGAKVNISGNYIISSITARFLNEKFTEDNMNENSLKFVLDLIFNPDAQNNRFKFFELAKRMVEDELKQQKENSKKYSLTRLLEELDSEKLFNPIGYIEDLNNITNNSLYNFYLKMLKSDLIDIFIIGDIDNRTVKKQIENFFTINTIKKKSTSHFITHKKIRSRSKVIIEEMDLEQSKLNIGMKLDKLTDFEKKYVLNVYTFILGGSPDSKLFKTVREKHSLCYTISASHLPVSNIIVIQAGIDKTQYKKCISLIKKEMKKITKGDFDEKDIEAAKITYISSLEEIEDSPTSILSIHESNEYLNFDLLEERYKNVLKVKKEDLIKLSKKIHFDTIYVLGGKDENN